jgi:DNA-binding response OmpR family regulator
MIASFIKAGLEREKFEVDTALDGDQAYRQMLTGKYCLVILDVLLPKKDGLSVIKDLRSRNIRTPILILTTQDTVDDIVAGFDSGSDGYLTKPFAVVELLARVRALIRRSEQQRGAVIRFADLLLDPVTRTVWRKDREIDLTPWEFSLLEFLMRNPNQVLSRTTIAENAWDKFDGFTNIVDVYVGHLRRKLGGGSAGKFIHSVRKIGFILTWAD